MKKKLYLRIRVLVLILLLILSSLIIAPEQVLADTEVVADEETPEVTSGEETTQVTADEEVTATINDTENQNNSGQTGNESETETDTETETETETETTTDTDTDTDEPQEKTSESAIGTEIDSAEAPSEPELDPVEETEASAPDEATNETDDVTSEATTLPTTESTSADDSQSTEPNAEGTDDTDTDTLPTVELPEAEQMLEEAISDKQDKEDRDVLLSDLAELGRGTRAYTPEEDFRFEPNTGTITRYIGTDTDVNIPPYISGVKVEYIGESSFWLCNITSVTIPDSVIEIEERAFGDNELTSVTIPNSVKIIHALAFIRNQLKNVTIPNSVISIDNYAFADNQLTSVTIPDSVLFIGVEAFANNQLTSVTIPSNLVNIGERAFSENSIIWASIPEDILFILDYDGTPLVSQPTAEQIGEYCFDNGVALYVKRYIKANYNIRETPNGKVITKLWRPLYVTGTKQGGWYKFTYNSKPAYVVMEATTTDPPPMTGYAKGNLNMRDVPGGSIIGTIPIGHKVQGKLVGNTVETTYNGKTGYVYASLLQKDPVQVTRYVKAGSNIRSTPGGTIIETLKMPILVTGTITGSYLRFTYKGQTVYVAMSLTTTQNPPITGYAKSTVNVRNAPGGSIIGTLPVGRQVKGVLAGNMVRFTYSSQTGYVYVSMLQATPVRVTRYVVANSIIRSAPGGSIIARPWRPLLVSGTIQGAWLKFTYNGRTAYVAMSSTTTQNPPITGYTKSTVNVRSTPNGSIIGSLPANRKVSGVLVGNWVKFTYADRTGYISASLLKK
ncbi:MAG: leucine-rich repeat protein [Saccharofermentanales bacterium]